jgi:PadR family transcriptional regulator, regulatory protein PadR
MPTRTTKTLIALLAALMTDPSSEWYGLELMKASGLSSGTLYPLLQRLVADGWLQRTREVASDAGGPTRRLYKLTGTGVLAADAALGKAAARARRRRPVSPRPGTVRP